jgi:cell division protease FtsH
MTRSQLLDRIRGMLGGRAAEEVIFGEVTTGAENDLEHATALARQMVCLFGMSDSVGLARCAQRQNGFLLPGTDGSFQRDCSEKTAEEIDAEVKRILEQAYAEAKEMLQEHHDQLELVSRELVRCETLDGEGFYRLIGRPATGKPASRGAGLELAPPESGSLPEESSHSE